MARKSDKTDQIDARAVGQMVRQEGEALPAIQQVPDPSNNNDLDTPGWPAGEVERTRYVPVAMSQHKKALAN